MTVNDPDYQNHEVFAQLKQYITFYEQLAFSVFGFVSVGTKAICNIDSYLFSSVEGTLTSIQMILRDGRINDSYALLRKYYDSAIINIYSSIFLQEHFSIDNFIVEEIDNWLKGKKRLPEYRIMSGYIRSSVKVAPITTLIFSDDRYKALRGRCNDHTHYNFYHNVLLNDNKIQIANRAKALKEFSEDLRDVLILHVAYLFFLNDHYMMSSDYLDCLDCGITPEPESQYWVAPFIQELLNQIVRPTRPDIIEVIKSHTSMLLV